MFGWHYKEIVKQQLRSTKMQDVAYRLQQLDKVREATREEMPYDWHRHRKAQALNLRALPGNCGHASAYFRAKDCCAVARDIIFISFVVIALSLMTCASFTGTLVERTPWAVAAVRNLTLGIPNFIGCAREMRRTTVILVRWRLQLIQWRCPPHSLNAVS